MPRGFPKWVSRKTSSEDGPRTNIAVLYDFSGSMGDEKAMEKFNGLLGRLCIPPSEREAFAVKVFPYGKNARTQDDFDIRLIDMSGTNIQAGVSELNRAINEHKAPGRFYILWLSDGADGDSNTIEVI